MASTAFLYDGRGFLRDALLTCAEPGTFEHTEPIYRSSGQLFSRRWRSSGSFGTPQDDGTVGRLTEDQTAYVFYFAGRPVAQLTTGSIGPGSGLVYLTADHLGTPVLATNSASATIWSGGFTPFGAPYQLMPPTLFLRLPGQWTDATWEGLGGGGIYYNVNRWYEPGVGRYEKPDPASWLRPAENVYGYTSETPTRFADPSGLLWVDCENCDQLKDALLNTMRRLFLLRTTGTAFSQYGSNRIGAATNCFGEASFDSRQPLGSTGYTYRPLEAPRFKDGPSVDY